jgi:hypothetical protein
MKEVTLGWNDYPAWFGRKIVSADSKYAFQYMKQMKELTWENI